MASTISAGTTSGTALNVTADTSGSLVLATNSGTTALTLNTSQNATFAGSVNAPNTFGFKNRIINGAMVIDQRNAGASGTANSYTVDRWQYYGSQSSKVTWQQNAGSVTPPAGFTNYLGFTSSSSYSITSTDQFQFAQYIEGLNISDLGWGTANAKTVTLSFQVYSSLTGTFGGALINSAGNRSYPFSYTVSSANTWTQISVTIAGDTTGTWLTTNGVGIQVNFSLGMGSTKSNTAGVWAAGFYGSATGAVSVVGTNAATWYVTGVQVEVGSQATSFDVRPYGTELQLCQRYYEQWNLANGNWQYLSNGFAFSGSGVRTILQFMVTKRANPSSTASGDLIFANSGKSATLSSGFSFDGAGLNSVLLYNDSTSGWTTGQAVQVSTSTSAKLTFSSEL